LNDGIDDTLVVVGATNRVFIAVEIMSYETTGRDAPSNAGGTLPVLAQQERFSQ
jgi:hypothetical protein